MENDKKSSLEAENGIRKNPRMDVKPTPVSTKEVKEVVNAMAGQKPETSKSVRLLLAKSIGLIKTEVAAKAVSTSSKSSLGNEKVDATPKHINDSKKNTVND